MSEESAASLNRYQAIIEKIFFDHYREGETSLEFERTEIPAAARALEIALPKNLGDVVYSIRYRTPLPGSVLATQPEGMEWIIDGVARSRYAFRLVKMNRIVPREEMATIRVPDATPEIIAAYAKNDEQALLAIDQAPESPLPKTGAPPASAPQHRRGDRFQFSPQNDRELPGKSWLSRGRTYTRGAVT